MAWRAQQVVCSAQFPILRTSSEWVRFGEYSRLLLYDMLYWKRTALIPHYSPDTWISSLKALKCVCLHHASGYMPDYSAFPPHDRKNISFKWNCTYVLLYGGSNGAKLIAPGKYCWVFQWRIIYNKPNLHRKQLCLATVTMSWLKYLLCI